MCVNIQGRDNDILYLSPYNSYYYIRCDIIQTS